MPTAPCPRPRPRVARFAALAVAVLAGFGLAPQPAGAVRGTITLQGSTTLTGSSRICDVWGWVDPATGREYAIVGNWYGPQRIWIVDVTDPTNPTEVSYVDGAFGFDPKAWDHYVYTCDGHSGNPSRIIDIADPTAPVITATTFQSTHNIAVSPGGLMACEIPGLTLYDLATAAATPDSLWRSTNTQGHDATFVGDSLLWDFGGWDGFARLWDVSNPSAPVLRSTVTWPALNYWHSGDVSADGNTLYVCDELSTHPEPDIHVFDVSDPANPVHVGAYAAADATVHNFYVVGDIGFASYYTAGFRTFDLSNPHAPVAVDSFDTSAFSGEGFDGAFGVYPFSPSGLVLVSDWDNGLFVFTVEGHAGPPTAVGDDRPRPARVAIGPNVPNPFNPSTRIPFVLARAGRVELTVYDVHGARVRRLVSGPRPAGRHEVTWDGRDDSGRPVASGVYIARLRSGPATAARRMVLLK